MPEYIDYNPGKEIEWIELNVLKNNSSLNKSQVTTLVGGEVTEKVIDSWFTTLEWRMNKYNRPIYTIENNIISPNFSWEDIPEYFLCLYYSFKGAGDQSGGTGIFEKISGQALKNFLGGEVYTLGFPAENNFNENLNNLASICKEVRMARAETSYKDDGVDVVGFKMFDDERSSNLYVLMQCAAGLHWTAKKPIAMARWVQYIQWTNRNLIESISTVEFIEEKKWTQHTTTYGMVLDRLRIYNFLYKTVVDDELREETLEWCRNKITAGI